MAGEETGITEFILTGLVNGALGNLGGTAFGDIFGMLSGGGGSGPDPVLQQIQAQLGQIQQELSDMRGDLQDILAELKQLSDQVQLVPALTTIDDLQKSVDGQFDQLRFAIPPGTEAVSDAMNWVTQNGMSALAALHQVIAPHKLDADPSFPGVLWFFASMAITTTQQDPRYTEQPGDFDPGSLLDVTYLQIEKYFRTLVGLQVQVATLLVNGYTSQSSKGLVHGTLVLLQSNLREQCDAFLWAVETYVVGYCVDDTLLTLLRRSAFTPDPIRRADRVANAFLYATESTDTMPQPETADAFRVRVWSATSTDGSLSTLTFVPLSSNGSGASGLESVTSTFALQQGSTTLAPTDTWHEVFDPIQNKQWSVFRHTYLGLQPGSWSIASPDDGDGAFNVVVDPYSYDAAYNGSVASLGSGPWVAVDDDVRGADYHVALTARTMLQLQGTGYAQADVTYDFRKSMTLELWVRNATPGTLVCSAMRDGDSDSTGPSGGIFALGLTDDLHPYGLVSVVWMEGYSHGQPAQQTQQNVTTACGVTLDDDAWHHLAAVLDHSQGTIVLYLDGQQLTATTNGYTGDGMGNGLAAKECRVIVGIPYVEASAIASSFSFSGYGSYANGCFSEVRVWACVQPPDQIAQWFNRRIASGAGLVGLWNLDAGNLDRSSHAGPLTLCDAGAAVVPMLQPDWLSLPSIAGAWEVGHQTLSDAPTTMLTINLTPTLFLAYRDGSNALGVQSSTDNGVTWKPLTLSTPIYMSSSPALTTTADAYGNTVLMIAYRSYDETNALGYATSLDGKQWTVATASDATFRGTPGFAKDGTGSGSVVLFRAIDGGNALWEYVLPSAGPAGTQQSTITLQGDPTGYLVDPLTTFIAFRANDPSHSLFIATGTLNDSLRGYPIVDTSGALVTLSGSPSIGADASGVLWIAYRWQEAVNILSITQQSASGTGPLLTASSNGPVTFRDPVTKKVTGYAITRGNPILSIINGTMYLTYRDRDDGETYWFTTSTDGVNWTWPPVRIATRWEQSLSPAPK